MGRNGISRCVPGGKNNEKHTKERMVLMTCRIVCVVFIACMIIACSGNSDTEEKKSTGETVSPAAVENTVQKKDEDRRAYEQEIQSQLTRYEEIIATIEKEAEHSTGVEAEKATEDIRAFRKSVDLATTQLYGLRAAKGDEWKNMKAMVDMAMRDLEKNASVLSPPD